MTTTESPNSFTVKCHDRNGYDSMFTVRADSSQEFMERVTKLLAWLPTAGFTPTNAPRRSPQAGNGAHAAPAANVPTCQYHGPMKESKYGGYFCPSKMGDGSYCKSKADGPASPAVTAAVAQVVSPAPLIANGTPAAPPPLFDDAPPPDFDSYYNEQN